MSLAVSGVVELVAVSGEVSRGDEWGEVVFAAGDDEVADDARFVRAVAVPTEARAVALVELPPVEVLAGGGEEVVRAEVEAVAAGRAGTRLPWMRNTGGASRNASSLGRAASRASGASTPTHRPSKCASA